MYGTAPYGSCLYTGFGLASGREKRNGTELQRCTDVGPAGESNAAAAGAAGPSSCLRFVGRDDDDEDDEVVVVVAGYAGPCWQLLPIVDVVWSWRGKRFPGSASPTRVG